MLTFILLTCLTTPAVQPEVEFANLTGNYVIVSVEKGGTKYNEGHGLGQTVRITQDRIVAMDKESKQTFVATYKLNPSKTPWIITMKSVLPKAGIEARGLIKKDGDMLWLIYQMPEGEVPTEFKSKEKQLMVTMKVLSK